MFINKKNKMRNRINRVLEVPDEVNLNMPKVTILNF